MYLSDVSKGILSLYMRIVYISFPRKPHNLNRVCCVEMLNNNVVYQTEKTVIHLMYKAKLFLK